MKAAQVRLVAVVVAAVAVGVPTRALAQTRSAGSPFARSVGISKRLSVEAFVDPHQKDESSYGFFGVQLKQRLVRAGAGRTEVFATFGSVGSYERQSQWEAAGVSVDGTSRFYETSRTNVEAPLLPVFGADLRSRITNHLTIRLGLQSVAWGSSSTIGARLSAGVSIAIGSAAQSAR